MGAGPHLGLMKPEWNVKIDEEVIKKLKADFLRVTDYPECLAT